MSYRKESDTIGEVNIQENANRKKKKQRESENFKIGESDSMPIEVIYA